MWKVKPIIFDMFKLDAGAMFGVVPKALWNMLVTVDDHNRMQMVTRCLLLEHGDSRVLIDCGIGSKWDQKSVQIYDIKNLAHGLDFYSVTDVLITHFHFDHAGGLTHIVNGEVLPRFPQARIWASRRNVEECLRPNVREKASYLRENIEPVMDKVSFIESEGEVLPGIKCYFSNGHTAGMCWFEIETDTGTVIYPSDLMPTSNHTKLTYNMGYDMCVRELISEKQFLLSRIKDTKATVYFEHDPEREKMSWEEF